MMRRMEIQMNKKKGTHSTQKKYFNTIPRSEFYGVALGYAFGLILGGLLRLESQIPQLALAVIGFGIGYFIDKKYYQEPDEPYEDSAETDNADDAEDPEEEGGSEFEEADTVEE
jgi:hypothetical protein